MKGQALAIAAVIAAGVTMFVAYLSNFDSLQRHARRPTTSASASPTCSPTLQARARERWRPASPRSRASWRVETRVVADVTLDVPGLAEPATGRLISIPERGAAAAERRLPAARAAGSTRRGPTRCWPARSSARRNGFGPGDSRGGDHQRPPAHADHRRRRRSRRSTSTASRPARSSPTTAASASSGWSGAALARAFDMEGGFNDVSLALGARRVAWTTSSPGSTACSSPTAASAPSRARCRSRPGRSTTSWRSCRRSASSCPRSSSASPRSS